MKLFNIRTQILLLVSSVFYISGCQSPAQDNSVYIVPDPVQTVTPLDPANYQWNIQANAGNAKIVVMKTSRKKFLCMMNNFDAAIK